jgi:Spy/CpxP family protein refolding chaperone
MESTMTRKGLMLAAAAVAALPWTASAHAQEPPGPPPHGPELGRWFGPGPGPSWAEEVGLSDEQKAQLEALRARRNETLKPLLEAARQAQAAFRQALEVEGADAATVGRAALSMHAAEKKLRADREAAFEEMKAVLTPEQLDKLKQVRAQRKGPGGPGRPGRRF